jgi:hypothetical protein
VERIFAARIVKTAALVQFGAMFRLLYALGALLVGWGAYVLLTGDFVATQDIAAGLVGSGVGVIALGAVVAALERIARQLATRPPVSGTMPSQMPVAEAPPRSSAPAAPTLVREGVVEGRRYRFFSDGSIEAEGPQGLRRYRSMEEAREDILRSRDQEPARRSEQPGTPRPPSRPARPGRAWENHLEPEPDEDRYAPPARGAPQDDDEWSEPFRMLLKGEPDPVDPGKR